MVAMLLKPEALPTELFSGSDEDFKQEYGFGATELQAIKIDQALSTGLIRNLIAHDLVLTDQADFYVSGVEQKTLSGNSPHWKTGYIEVKKQKIPLNQVIDVLLYLK
jgi:hypothetical protein